MGARGLRLFIAGMVWCWLSAGWADSVPPRPDFGPIDSNWVEANWCTWGTTTTGVSTFPPSRFEYDQDAGVIINAPTLTPGSPFQGQNGVNGVYQELLLGGGGSASLELLIFNFEDLNQFKRIWLELIWEDRTSSEDIGGNTTIYGATNDWGFTVDPAGRTSDGNDVDAGAVQFSGQQRINSRWVRGIWYVELTPNPEYEILSILANALDDGWDEALVLDCVRVTTQCIDEIPPVPEPSSMGLLGLGIAALIIRQISRQRYP